MAGLRRVTPALALLLLAPPVAWATPLPPTWAYAGTVGDLDGDGLRDVAIRASGSTGAIEVRRGGDGAVLWHADEPGPVYAVVPAPVGAGPGIVATVGNGLVRGYDGAGHLVWTAVVPGAGYIEAYDDSVVAVTQVSIQYPDSEVYAEILAAASGAVRARVGPVRAPGDLPYPVVTGDLGGDHRPDLVWRVTDGNGDVALSALDGRTGAGLWSVPATAYGRTVPVPDLTGDGTADLVSLDGGAATLRSGADGHAVWVRGASWTISAGAAGVILGESTRGKTLTVRLSRVDGAGRVRATWSTSVAPTGPPDGTGVIEFGDVTGDGVMDVAVFLDWWDAAAKRAGARRVVVDGRRLRTVRRDLGQVERTVYAAIDGHGADTVTLDRTKLVARDGRTGRRLWSVAYPGVGSAFFSAADVTGDRHADVLMSGDDPAAGPSVWLLDGATGATRWSVSYNT